MEDAPPVTTDGRLQPPSVVEGWTPQELFDFVLKQRILGSDEIQTTFQNAWISGKAFLMRGDDLHFWTDVCHLPAGPSVELEGLAQRIKNMGKEESRGNAFHLGSNKPANTFTVQSPPPPHGSTKDFERLKFLHGLLWGQEEHLSNTVFCNFKHPSWDRDTNPHINSDDTRTAVKLTLSHFTTGERRLPCRADELLVRKAYEEMYDILLKAQKDRRKYPEEKCIPDKEKIILILGQPGIGKTWFLSYVLVRRLLEGKPTIFQVGKNRGSDGRHTAAAHYLINGNGVCLVDEGLLDSESDNAGIWVLADQRPIGAPENAENHRWLVVVTSSPRKENYHYLVKEYMPRTFYLPTWDWHEVVAAA